MIETRRLRSCSTNIYTSTMNRPCLHRSRGAARVVRDASEEKRVGERGGRRCRGRNSRRRKEREEGRKEEIGSCVHSAVGLFLPQPSKTPRLEAGQRGERDATVGNILFLNEITGEGKEPRCKENRVCGRKRRRRGVKESRERYNTCPLADEGSLFGTSEKRIGREERRRFRTAERDGYRL